MKSGHKTTSKNIQRWEVAYCQNCHTVIPLIYIQIKRQIIGLCILCKDIIDNSDDDMLSCNEEELAQIGYTPKIIDDAVEKLRYDIDNERFTELIL